MNLEEHMKRHIAFSRATFGPDERTAGVSDHIRKELVEIAQEADPYDRAKEWVDVVILGLDGLWRALQADAPGLTTDHLAESVVALLVMKQGRNEKRTWPDWRTADPSKAIEHVRSAAE